MKHVPVRVSLLSGVRDRSVRFALGLGLAISVPVAVLLYLQFRSLSDLEHASAEALEQFSHQAADGLATAIEEELRAPQFDVLWRLRSRSLQPLDLELAASTFAESLERSPFVDAFYVWAEGEHDDQVLAYARDGATGGRPLADDLASGNGDATRALVSRFGAGIPEAQLILETARTLALGSAWAIREVLIDGRPAYLVLQLRLLSSGPMTELPRELRGNDRLIGFVGFRVDVQRLYEQHLAALVRKRLSQFGNPPGFLPLVVTILDGHGAPLFNSSGSVPSLFIDERVLHVSFFDRGLTQGMRRWPDMPAEQTWTLRTGYGERTVAAMVRERIRPQRALMTVLAAAMAVVVLFIAVAAAREIRLAELKSSFVSSVSHDLKTPLALIQLFAETLELGRVKSAERIKEYSGVIGSEARRLTTLINNILDFSQIEAGLRRYKLVPTGLSELTVSVLASLDAQLRQRDFTVRHRIDPRVPPVMGDAQAIRQALENLLSNAMKYSREGTEIEVEVGCTETHAFVRVTDQGKGIARRFHNRIFRKFFRVDPASGPTGCGLGLAIVDHIMREHGGAVAVRSEPGRGSTFTLYFQPAVGEQYAADSSNRGRAADVARSA